MTLEIFQSFTSNTRILSVNTIRIVDYIIKHCIGILTFIISHFRLPRIKRLIKNVKKIIANYRMRWQPFHYSIKVCSYKRFESIRSEFEYTWKYHLYFSKYLERVWIYFVWFQVYSKIIAFQFWSTYETFETIQLDSSLLVNILDLIPVHNAIL